MANLTKRTNSLRLSVYKVEMVAGRQELPRRYRK
jgi:hypothetical protein